MQSFGFLPEVLVLAPLPIQTPIKKTNDNKSTQPSYTNMTCPRCSKTTSVQVNGYTKVCSNCGWQLTKAYINTVVKLAGVTYDGRQGLISSLSVYDPIIIKRDRNNDYENAIGIYNSRNQNIGWIPRDVAVTIQVLCFLQRPIKN